jgi:hypothetical protein
MYIPQQDMTLMISQHWISTIASKDILAPNDWRNFEMTQYLYIKVNTLPAMIIFHHMAELGILRAVPLNVVRVHL